MYFHLLQQSILFFFREIGKLYRRCESDPPVIYIFQNFGDQICETDVATHLFSTFSTIRTYHFISATLRHNLCRS